MSYYTNMSKFSFQDGMINQIERLAQVQEHTTSKTALIHIPQYEVRYI